MKLMTRAFPDSRDIPVRFNQAAQGAKPGEGISPPRIWADASASTQNLGLNLHDLQTRVNVMKAIQGHIVGKAVYFGSFHPPQ